MANGANRDDPDLIFGFDAGDRKAAVFGPKCETEQLSFNPSARHLSAVDLIPLEVVVAHGPHYDALLCLCL